ncbi:MAG: AAA family ATPase [Myxococcales bacterium]|nr:AAA family ATPase [Deltaproteobacteria bacterium]NND28863.1 AAA family ATPase [Myxococcales bacterium]MBT8482335.1 AAA family ATPase [Deltaproteobacteria bacterium]NNK42170.1 AAA family ATPase [Myxococcales bacterium]NNL25198.1 AAA family ATPase [Myxococcales bacterium]
MSTSRELPVSALYRSCDLRQLDFETTHDLAELNELVAQERAADAIGLGASIQHEGYNLFVLGREGTGRHSLLKQYLEEKARTEPLASDWCYLNNFQESRQPRAIELPAGRGRELAQDMAQLVDDARTAIPAAFESEDYRTRRESIERELAEEQEAAFEEVSKRAKERGIGIIQTPTGMAMAPIRDEETLAPEEFQQLPEAERERIVEQTEEVGKELKAVLQEAPKRVREARRRVSELDREVALWAVGSLIEELTEKYEAHQEVVRYLQQIREDIVQNIGLFRVSPEEHSPLQQLFGGAMPGEGTEASPATQRYAVNVLVDHEAAEGAPVVFEQNPTFQRLLGRVEHLSQMGTLVTNFQLIKAGALHDANGGYLVLDARKLLTQPFAYDGLKRALQSRELRIESLGQAYSLVSTVSLDPEPIPLSVKVVLIGERLLYYMLQALDPEFSTLFKVAADFEDEVDRSEENTRLYARLLATLAKRASLKPLDREAVARVIEHSAREVGDGEKLSARIRPVADIIREADFWAGKEGSEIIALSAVEQAIEARARRNGRIRDRMHEEILRNNVLIDTAGEVVGQINGLAVLQIGDSRFGRPNRITARIALGTGKVVDIEREVELGGPIHSKGVFILSSYLAATYAADEPLSLSASLVFEQSYGGVEGDSASCAELCALLSALAESPIDQSLAVTGSVNQRGEVQAIGGANEKIEGFFDICQARGLTGSQGVLIPAANIKNLMLRRDVRDAVEKGLFRVCSVENVDQAMEILCGVPSGQAAPNGAFPEGSLNQRVGSRLSDLAQKRRKMGSDEKSEEGN